MWNPGPRIERVSPALGRWILYHYTIWEAPVRVAFSAPAFHQQLTGICPPLAYTHCLNLIRELPDLKSKLILLKMNWSWRWDVSKTMCWELEWDRDKLVEATGYWVHGSQPPPWRGRASLWPLKLLGLHQPGCLSTRAWSLLQLQRVGPSQWLSLLRCHHIAAVNSSSSLNLEKDLFL